MNFEFSNWYNDPFNDKPGSRSEKKDLRAYRYGKLVCKCAHDSRKQKTCKYYYRNSTTKKCLSLINDYKCDAYDV